MAISCPNCGIPCTGCAGAKITTASNGVKCCTKCLPRLEATIKANQQPQQPTQK
jgi:coenzyme F420-reducing hydrogenase gamma subunit